MDSMIRRSGADESRFQTCQQWREFYQTTQNPVAQDLWSILSSYESETTGAPGARALVESLTGIPQIGVLRRACAGDPVLAAAVTVMLKDFTDELAEQLTPIFGNGDGHTPGDGEDEGQPGDGDGEEDEGGHSLLDSEIAAAVQRTAKYLDTAGAEEKLDQTEKGFSLVGENLTLQERLMTVQVDLKKLAKINQMIGVMRKVTTESLRTIRESAPNATLPRQGYGGGTAALTTLQPVEIASIATGGTTEALFWKRWQNNRAKVTRTQVRVPAATGPMVVLGDESYSMIQGDLSEVTGVAGSRSIDWLMALVIATAEQCQQQRRMFLYQGWSDTIPRSRRFSDMNHVNRMTLIEQPILSGTDLAAAIQAGIREIQQISGPRKRADLLVITDGSWYLSNSLTKQLTEKLHALNSRAHLLLVEQQSKLSDAPKPGGLWESVHFVTDIVQSSTVVAHALA